MSLREVRRMYEFSALDCGLGAFLVAWGLVAHFCVGTRRSRPPFRGEGPPELVQRPLLCLAREHLPGVRPLRRPRGRVRREDANDFEDVGAVAGEVMLGCREDRVLDA